MQIAEIKCYVDKPVGVFFKEPRVVVRVYYREWL